MHARSLAAQRRLQAAQFAGRHDLRRRNLAGRVDHERLQYAASGLGGRHSDWFSFKVTERLRSSRTWTFPKCPGRAVGMIDT